MNPSELRYCVGVILSEGDSEPDEGQLKAYLDHGFKEVVLPPADHAVLTSFPFNNTVSIFIGVARVYPKLAEYIRVMTIPIQLNQIDFYTLKSNQSLSKM